MRLRNIYQLGISQITTHKFDTINGNDTQNFKLLSPSTAYETCWLPGDAYSSDSYQPFPLGNPFADLVEIFDFVAIVNYDALGPWSPTIRLNFPLNYLLSL